MRMVTNSFPLWIAIFLPIISGIIIMSLTWVLITLLGYFLSFSRNFLCSGVNPLRRLLLIRAGAISANFSSGILTNSSKVYPLYMNRFQALGHLLVSTTLIQLSPLIYAGYNLILIPVPYFFFMVY